MWGASMVSLGSSTGAASFSHCSLMPVSCTSTEPVNYAHNTPGQLQRSWSSERAATREHRTIAGTYRMRGKASRFRKSWRSPLSLKQLRGGRLDEVVRPSGSVLR